MSHLCWTKTTTL